MLISKEQFIKYLNALKEEYAELDKFEEALKPFFDCKPLVTSGTKFRDAYKDMLVEMCECQEEDDIFWWWLFDGGKKILDVEMQPGGDKETYDVSTPEGLYDYLCYMYHHDD
jgi:hypothetical protein